MRYTFKLLVYFLFTALYAVSQNPYPTTNGIVVLDPTGRQINFFEIAGIPLDVEPLPDGGFCVTTGDGLLLQMDMNGNILSQNRIATSTDVDVMAPHQFLLTSRAYKRIELLDTTSNQTTKLETAFVGPSDTDILPNGNLLVCDAQAQKIIEITTTGEVVWEYRGELKQPMDAIRLIDGNTLISDFDNHRVIEIQTDGTIVHVHQGFNHPQKLFVLSEFEVLVADSDLQRLVKLNRNGEKEVIQNQLNYIVSSAYLSNENVYLCAVQNRFQPPEAQTSLSASVTGANSPSSSWLFNRYTYFGLVVVLGLILWCSRSTQEWACLAFVTYYVLLLGIGYICIVEAASGYPYQPGWLFYVVVITLMVSTVSEIQTIYLTRDHWKNNEQSFDLPYSWGALAVIFVISILALFFQFDHAHGMEHLWQSTALKDSPDFLINAVKAFGQFFRGWFPKTEWYVPMLIWGITVYLLFRWYLFFPGNAPQTNPPFTTGSVSHYDGEEHNAQNKCHNWNAAYWKQWVTPIWVTAIIIAGLLYIVGATGVPYDVHGDEAEVALHGIETRDSGKQNIFNLSWYLIPNLFFLIPAWGMWVVGDGLFGLRLSGALIGVGSVALFFLFAKRLMVPAAAAIATFLFAASTYFVHFSRIGTSYNQATFFTIAVLLLVMKGMQEKKAWCIASAGFLAGLSLLSYQACKIIAPVAVFTIVLSVMFQNVRVRDGFKMTALFCMGVWITLAPIIGNFLKDPAAISSRTNSVSVFHEDGRRYMRYNYPGDMTMKEIVFEQFRRTTFAPVTYQDSSPYINNLQHGGMLDPLPAVLFSAGLLSLFVMIFQPNGYLLLSWYLILLYPASALTNGAPSYQRLVCLIPILPLIAAPVLTAVFSQAARRMKSVPYHQPVLIVTVLSILFLMGFNRYFYQIMAVPQLLDDHTRVARHLDETGPTAYTYMFGRDRFSIQYGTIRFLAPDAKGMDINHPEQFVKTKITRTGPIQFLFIGKDTEYVDEIQKMYPGGKLEYHYNRENKSPFITYQVNQ